MASTGVFMIPTLTVLHCRSAAAALMMGEEFHKFSCCCRPEKSDFSAMGFGGNANSGSRKIFLTFKPNCTFTEEDVANYFSKFGPVQDITIPHQQQQMFGFVAFFLPETVETILARGNHHFVCGSQVLVKRYKEKGQVQDKGESSTYSSRSGYDSREPYHMTSPSEQRWCGEGN